MHYALIRNNTVENIIVADNDFVGLIRSEWDAIVSIGNNEDRVAIGWLYENNALIAPAISQEE